MSWYEVPLCLIKVASLYLSLTFFIPFTFQMNSLRSLLRVCHQVPDEEGVLSAFQASRFNVKTPLGRSVADVGCEPILHMRHFQVSELCFVSLS